MSEDLTFSAAAAVASLIDAILALIASSIEVPDNLDRFIDALQKSGQWSWHATLAALIAAVCSLAMLGRLFPLARHRRPDIHLKQDQLFAANDG